MVHISLIIDIKISRLSITEGVNVEDAAWFRITEIADIVSLSFLGLYTETKNVRDDFGRASEEIDSYEARSNAFGIRKEEP